MNLPTEEVAAWVEEQVGPFEPLECKSHSHGYSEVWLIRAQGERIWLKCHANDHKQAGEIHALTRWTPALGTTPRIVAYRQNPNAVLLTDEPGTQSEELDLEGAAEERLWEQAGAWVARLHQIENDWFGVAGIDGSPLAGTETSAEAITRQTIERRLREGDERGLFSPTEREFILWGAREWLPSLADARPRAVHRDFTPRNWLANADGALTCVIDFEHARWDVPAMDFTRPWDHEWRRNPRLIDAFFGAYGSLDERLKAQVQALRLMMAASTIVWGVMVNELDFSQRYRDALHRTMEEHGRRP